MLPGTTLVVSPLISLMKDQVDELNRRGIRLGVASLDAFRRRPARGVERSARRSAAAVVCGARALRLGSVPAAARRARRRPLRRRRSALRLRVGPRLPPRLPPAARRRGAVPDAAIAPPAVRRSPPSPPRRRPRCATTSWRCSASRSRRCSSPASIGRTSTCASSGSTSDEDKHDCCRGWCADAARSSMRRRGRPPKPRRRV